MTLRDGMPQVLGPVVRHGGAFAIFEDFACWLTESVQLEYLRKTFVLERPLQPLLPVRYLWGVGALCVVVPQFISP